MILNEQIEN